MNSIVEPVGSQPVAIATESHSSTAPVVALVQPLTETIAASMIKPGCKKLLVSARVAAGVDKKLALREFALALGNHRAALKADSMSVLSLEGIAVASHKRTATGGVIRWVDIRETEAAKAEKTRAAAKASAERLAKKLNLGEAETAQLMAIVNR